MIALNGLEVMIHLLYLALHKCPVLTQGQVLLQLVVDADVLLLLPVRNGLQRQIFLLGLLVIPLNVHQILSK